MTRRFLLHTALFATLAATPALAEDVMIQVSQPWARASAGQGTTAAAYLTVIAHGEGAALTGASTPVAGMAMLHETRIENGVAKMTMLDSVPLPPHTPVTFKPGAMHVMLTGLKQPLKAGTSFSLTLTFDHAAPVTVTVPVLAPGAAGPAGADSGKMDDMPGMKMD